MLCIADKEYELLRLLRIDARISLAEAARILGWPLSTTCSIYQRVQPFVRRYTTLFDLQRLFPLHLVYVCVLLPEQEHAFTSLIRTHPAINTCFHCYARHYVLECVFSGLLEQHRFEQKLICSFSVHPILKEYVREEFFSTAVIL